jgi:hypothetical protein
MTERELRTSIVRAAREFGWRVYFTWTSMHSPAGFPDLCMVKGPRLVFAELKAEKGKVTVEQQAWLADLSEASHDGHDGGARFELYVWRPADLEDAYRVLMR